MGLPRPEKEYRFCPTRRWRVDYAFPEYKLAVEIEGGIFGRGPRCPKCGRRWVAGHTSIQRLKADIEKYNQLALAGWSLLRFTPDEIKTGEAYATIKEWFEKKEKANAIG